MMMSPVFSSSAPGVKVTFVVTVNSGPGNFCSRRFGASHRFLKIWRGRDIKYPQKSQTSGRQGPTRLWIRLPLPLHAKFVAVELIPVGRSRYPPHLSHVRLLPRSHRLGL